MNTDKQRKINFSKIKKSDKQHPEEGRSPKSRNVVYITNTFEIA